MEFYVVQNHAYVALGVYMDGYFVGRKGFGKTRFLYEAEYFLSLSNAEDAAEKNFGDQEYYITRFFENAPGKIEFETCIYNQRDESKDPPPSRSSFFVRRPKK